MVTAQNAIVESLKADAFLFQLLLGIFMPVEAELGIVWEIGTELQEEGSEIAVQAVDIELVDHGGGSHQPGIRGAGVFIAAAFGAEHRGLLLGLADEDHALGASEFA